MAQILVRNIDDTVHAELRDLAKAGGVSLEQYLRERLAEIASRQRPRQVGFATQIRQIVGDAGLRYGEDFPEWKGEAVRVPTFD